jgi:23S rRNA (pseudouridine1915-N3)-methyltransferase
MQIFIKAIGKEKSEALKSLSDEYSKRLPWKISVVEEMCSKKLPAQELKAAEARLLLNAAPSQTYKIALDEKGKMLSSTELAHLISQVQLSHKSISFFIGGAHGHGQELIKSSDLVLSLSKMTFAHKIVRLLLIEQIYRAYTIITNHPYHKV